MRYGADMKAAQIAEVLETSTNGVEVALHRALRRLRDVLRGRGAGAAVGLRGGARCSLT